MRQFFSDLRNDLLLSGAISLLLGLVLIFFPDTTSFLICYLCAGVMILFGLFQLLAFLFSDRAFPNHSFYLARCVLLLVLGVYFAIRPGILVSMLPMVLGLFVVVAGLMKIQNAVDLRRWGAARWSTVLAVGILTTLVGAVTLMHPFSTAMVLLRFLGICLLVSAVLDGWAVFTLHRDRPPLKERPDHKPGHRHQQGR